MLRLPAVCAAILALTAVLGAGPALAASPSPVPTPTASPTPRPSATPAAATVVATPPPVGSPVPVSTASAVAAAALAAQVARQQQALAAENAHLAAASAAATATLQTYQAAQRAADLAARQATQEQARLVTAVRRTALARAQFNGYVGSLYRTGMVDPRVLSVSAALAAPDSRAFFQGLGLADRVGTSQSQSLDELGAAQADQATQADQARVAQALQRGTATRALAAKAAADKVVADSTARVAAQTAALVKAHGALAVARAREASLAAADAIARQRSGLPADAVAGAAAHPVGSCVGADISGYPNGMLPTTALCPLWGTAGQVLRADATAAFDALSHDYAAQFAAPICVTDSYRDYAGQVALKILKPTLAATPGQSQHGWAVAVDLCDGIERFDTVQHAWMLLNAARFGWFHPSWAEPTGAKPEPWHWEYAGSAVAPPPPVPPVDLTDLQRTLHR